MRPATQYINQQPTYRAGSRVIITWKDIVYTRLKGAEDVRDRIACALSAKSSEVSIDHYKYKPCQVAAWCSGSWNEKRFFAKILLAEPYPIPTRFGIPWETPEGALEPTRPVSEQIEAEWNMTLKMQALSGGRSVPAPFGRSASAGTIVWEEVQGIPLVRLLKSSRWRGSIAAAGAKALFHAGMWLRNIHEASRQERETIDMHHLIKLANDFVRQKGPHTSSYDRVVPKILEASLAEIGGAGTVRVPIAFTHGDFCLSNLIAEITNYQLAVVDFEMCGDRPIHYDLFGLVYELRSQLLNPVVPKAVILSWEKSFWAGYGPTSAQLHAFVKAMALARIFYHDFFQLLTRRERKGWIAGATGQFYRTFLEPMVITRRLDLPRELCHFCAQLPH